MEGGGKEGGREAGRDGGGGEGGAGGKGVSAKPERNAATMKHSAGAAPTLTQ